MLYHLRLPLVTFCLLVVFIYGKPECILVALVAGKNDKSRIEMTQMSSMNIFEGIYLCIIDTILCGHSDNRAFLSYFLRISNTGLGFPLMNFPLTIVRLVLQGFYFFNRSRETAPFVYILACLDSIGRVGYILSLNSIG